MELYCSGGSQMKLTKKLTTLAIVGAISATTAVASAANIGLVQMSQVVNSYPGYGALDMKMQQVDAQYRPQIEKKMQEIDKIKDQAQAEAEFNKSVAPLLQKENDEVNKIAQPMMQNIHNAIESVRVEKKMDVVLDDPYTIRAADANSNVENITDEVIKRIKKEYLSLEVESTSPLSKSRHATALTRSPKSIFERGLFSSIQDRY